MVIRASSPPAEIVLATPVAVPTRADAHPVAVYLARLAPGSRRTMLAAMKVIAAVLAPGATPETLPWHRLRYQHTQAVRAALADRYAPGGANKMLCALRGVLKECRRLGLMTAEDATAAADLAPVRGSRLPAGRALAHAELRALFETAAPRDAALLAVLCGCGLRRAEAAGLDLADYDRAAAALRVRGKGNKERRVPVPPDVARALAAWLAVRGIEPGALFWSQDPGHLGDRLTPDGARTVLARLASRAGVASFSPHDLRRSYVSALLDAGADLSTVQKMAGHASPNTTARYDRRGEDAMRRAAGLLRIPA